MAKRKEEKKQADLFLGSLSLYHCVGGSFKEGAELILKVKIKAK